jgi:hypothetical protein
MLCSIYQFHSGDTRSHSTQLNATWRQNMIVQPAKLRKGSGSGAPEDGLCLMQMVDWFSGSDHVTDCPKCASPVLSKFAIYVNDLAPSQSKRDELWPLTWRLIGSADASSEQARAEYLVRAVTHRLVAPLFVGEHRNALLNAKTMVEIETAARAVTSAARTISAAAEAAAEAAEAAAEAAADAESAWWDITREILVEAIELGPRGQEDPVYIPRAEQLVKILEDA